MRRSLAGWRLAPALALAFASSAANAALPDGCRTLGVAITEHSCFHSEFGPFTTVMATPGSAATATTPDVSPVHTEYRVGLTGEQSAVKYTPRRTGAWAVLLGSDVPLQVLPSSGAGLVPILSQAGDTGCAALPVLHVFELTAEQQYRLVLGPTDARFAVVVIEYIDDFLTENGRDADGDGFGSDAEVIVTPCAPPAGFAPNVRDCDDGDPTVHPQAEERCDGVDQNCNGVPDDVGLLCRAGAGICRVEGRLQCVEAGAAVSCSEPPLGPQSESCNGLDDDCNGKIDDAPDLCPDPERPACVRSGMTARCGCQLDLDCGDAGSGRVCDVESGTCRDGCSLAPGRNGCAPGSSCNPETSRCELGSGGVQGTSGGPSGTEPGGGGEGGSASAGTGDTAGSEQTSRSSSGCGCAVPGSRSGTGGAAWLLGLLVVGAWRRAGRWPAAVAAAGLLLGLSGCGGRVQAEPGDGEPVTEPDAGGGASGPMEPECQPKLGQKLVEHACSHAVNGPFITVASGGKVPPPDVSELHKTYEVQLVGGPPTVSYRAQRDGEHAFMSDQSVTVFVMSSDGNQRRAAPFPVQGCSGLTHAATAALERGVEYQLLLAREATEGSGSVLRLFVEHLAAFGSRAWLRACPDPDGG